MRYLIILGLFISGVAGAGIIPTHEQQIQLNLAQGIVRLTNTDAQMLTQEFSIIWKDKLVTPCQVWADLGTQAAATRTAFFSLIAFINGNGGSISLSEPSGYTMTNNSDGTVTCVAPSPSPSPSGGP